VRPDESDQFVVPSGRPRTVTDWFIRGIHTEFQAYIRMFMRIIEIKNY
jgi:hypothetical protein